MKYIKIDGSVHVEWTVLKCNNGAKENFAEALMSLFLVDGDHMTKRRLPFELKDNVIVTDISGVPYGVYSLELVWMKNHKFPRKGCLYRSTADDVFAVSDENDSVEPSVKVAIKSHMNTFGYDGLSAYEKAVLLGKTELDEEDWVANLAEMNQKGEEFMAEIGEMEGKHAEAEAERVRAEGERRVAEFNREHAEEERTRIFGESQNQRTITFNQSQEDRSYSFELEQQSRKRDYESAVKAEWAGLKPNIELATQQANNAAYNADTSRENLAEAINTKITQEVNPAINYANRAADRAEDWAERAQDATYEAGQATEKANTATNNANGATTTALNAARDARDAAAMITADIGGEPSLLDQIKTATTNANDKAGYAKAQGDYAKAKGDSVQTELSKRVLNVDVSGMSIHAMLDEPSAKCQFNYAGMPCHTLPVTFGGHIYTLVCTYHNDEDKGTRYYVFENKELVFCYSSSDYVPQWIKDALWEYGRDELKKKVDEAPDDGELYARNGLTKTWEKAADKQLAERVKSVTDLLGLYTDRAPLTLTPAYSGKAIVAPRGAKLGALTDYDGASVSVEYSVTRGDMLLIKPGKTSNDYFTVAQVTVQNGVKLYEKVMSLNELAEVPTDGYLRFLVMPSDMVIVVTFFSAEAAFDQTIRVMRCGAFATISTQVGNIYADLKENYAKAQGYYRDLHCGVADSLGADPSKTYTEVIPCGRPLGNAGSLTDGTGGSHSPESIGEVSTVEIKEIEGDAFGGNQILKNNDMANGFTDWSKDTGTITAKDGYVTIAMTSSTFQSPAYQRIYRKYNGHKVMLIGKVRSTERAFGTSGVGFFQGSGNAWKGFSSTKIAQSPTWQYLPTIFAPDWADETRIGLGFYGTGTIDFGGIQALDLTTLFPTPSGQTFVATLGENDTPKVLDRLGFFAFMSPDPVTE